MRPDWVTISSLATAGGTLVLAIATFSAVRSANRAARTSERSFLVALRPVLFQSRRDDPTQKIRWVDNHYARVDGGQASIENVDGVMYLAMSLRNVGSGIAVIQAWRADRAESGRTNLVRPDLDDFCPQTRDLYVPAGDSSFWQAAIREPDDRHRLSVLEGIEAGSFSIDVLYSDHEGGQRTISRFYVNRSPSEESTWLCSVVRHWNLDRRDPH
ncbi:MAG: hypothetical protein QOD49_1831 [Actinomycetota bacterium]|nr:hypothetical protein [Actinomycetota bacterium]